MSDPIDTAHLRAAFGLDKPWTGGPHALFHLQRALAEIDRIRVEALCDWTQHPDIPVAPYHFVDMVRAAARGEAG
jgi:hypothetical protein